MSGVEIQVAQSAGDYGAAAELFRRYAAELQLDLCFQGFEAELGSLETMYGPPRGCLLLARCGGQAVGCVAVRPMDDAVCEMKRLYVAPEWRGSGLGRRLAQEIIECAAGLEYSCMRLDTLERMTSAIGLYESLDFRRSAAYYSNPLEKPVFFELRLR